MLTEVLRMIYLALLVRYKGDKNIKRWGLAMKSPRKNEENDEYQLDVRICLLVVSYNSILTWLVVWNILYFPIYWE